MIRACVLVMVGAVSALTAMGCSGGASAESEDEETSTGDAGSTTGVNDTGGELRCDLATSRSDCEAMMREPGLVCQWVEVVPVDPLSCERGEAAGRCVESVVHTAGCSGSLCFVGGRQPYFEPSGREILLNDKCGNEPVGWSPCPEREPNAPDACCCMCPEVVGEPGPTSGPASCPGDGGDSSTTGG